jgi:hypothetical protein
MRIMNSAIAGLIGAAIGAGAGLAGTFITQYLQIRAQRQQTLLHRSTEREQALRVKREEAYKKTLQRLIRVRDRRMSDLKLYRTTGAEPEPGRTTIEPEGAPNGILVGDVVLVGDVTRFREEAFDDIVGARLWLTSAIAYCSPKARSQLLEAMNALETFATNTLKQRVFRTEEEHFGPGLVEELGLEIGPQFMMWAAEYDDALTSSYEIVLSCAQDDLRDTYK